jgi:hypothetical protein
MSTANVRLALTILSLAFAIPQAGAEGDPTALVATARGRFPDLGAAEQRLVEAFVAGRKLDLRTGDAGKDDPATGAGWSKDRAVRLDVLAWMLNSAEARSEGDSRGVRLIGGRIESSADGEGLSGVSTSVAVSLRECFFPAGLNVREAELGDLDLSGSRLDGALLGDDLKVDRSCKLTAVAVQGDVALKRLRAGTNVDLTDARIAGTLHLPAAEVAGQMWLTGAEVLAKADDSGEPPIAINLDQARIGGTLSLDGDGPERRFAAHGTVRLVLAHIGGNLDCWNGSFDCGVEDSDADALLANGLDVGGSVLLCHDFSCRGKTSLRTARITHYLNLYENQRNKRDDQAPALGAAFLDLQACRTGTLNCDTLSWTQPGRLVLNGFVYDRFELVRQDGDAEEALDLADADFGAWLRQQPAEPFFPHAYEHLAELLRREGYADRAREASIAMERELAERARTGPRGWVWRNVFGPMIGYGYNPLLGLRWLVGAWLVGTVAFWRARNAGLLVDSQGRPADGQLQPLVYSFDVMVPLVKLGQADRWGPRRDVPAGVALQWFHWGLILAGWTLTTLVVAGLTGLVRH